MGWNVDINLRSLCKRSIHYVSFIKLLPEEGEGLTSIPFSNIFIDQFLFLFENLSSSLIIIVIIINWIFIKCQIR